ncbi:MAG: hypothetical protein L0Y70_10610 [Gemmataceae bacterium]|nr:hypothetical protein [Gemmataceae bacterium]
MDLHEALTQISEIRQQVARTEVFRGYKAAPVALSGGVALVAALLQATWLPVPAADLGAYLTLWIGAALVSLIATGVAMVLHCKYAASALTRTTALLAVGQFAPSIVAGGLLAFVLWHNAPETLWMLPGLWAMLFGLGVFASYRLLPRAIFWVGVHYVVTGAFVLAWAKGAWAFSPWAMAIPFGVGQLLAAAILYWTLERRYEQKQESTR